MLEVSSNLEKKNAAKCYVIKLRSLMADKMSNIASKSLQLNNNDL